MYLLDRPFPLYHTGSSDSGISTGAIVGIVIGGVAILIIVIVVVPCFVLYKKKRKFSETLSGCIHR